MPVRSGYIQPYLQCEEFGVRNNIALPLVSYIASQVQPKHAAAATTHATQYSIDNTRLVDGHAAIGVHVPVVHRPLLQDQYTTVIGATANEAKAVGNIDVRGIQLLSCDVMDWLLCDCADVALAWQVAELKTNLELRGVQRVSTDLNHLEHARSFIVILSRHTQKDTKLVNCIIAAAQQQLPIFTIGVDSWMAIFDPASLSHWSRLFAHSSHTMRGRLGRQAAEHVAVQRAGPTQSRRRNCTGYGRHRISRAGAQCQQIG